MTTRSGDDGGRRSAGEVGPSTVKPEQSSAKNESVLAIRRAASAQKHDLLFETWSFSDGFVSLDNLRSGVDKLRSSADEFHLRHTADAASTALEQLDTPERRRMNQAEFRVFVEELTTAMHTPFNLVSEFLLLSALDVHATERPDAGLLQPNDAQEKTEELAKLARRTAALAEDARVERAFAYFNRSGSGQISFLELSKMLHKLRQDDSLEEARAQAVSMMLLCDPDSKRSLGYEEFTRFLQRLAVLLHMDAAVLAENLLDIARSGAPEPSSPAGLDAGPDHREAIAQVYETLSDGKLHLLFELWDKDGDGLIGFAELALGLRKFSPADEAVTDVASNAAEALLLFNFDRDQKLDRAEFARFINSFCDACGSDFATMADFLILLAALDDNPSEELAFLLSEDKVEKAVADLTRAWSANAMPNPFAAAASRSAEARQPEPQPPGEPSARPGEAPTARAAPEQPVRHPSSAISPFSQARQQQQRLSADAPPGPEAGPAERR